MKLNLDKVIYNIDSLMIYKKSGQFITFSGEVPLFNFKGFKLF